VVGALALCGGRRKIGAMSTEMPLAGRTIALPETRELDRLAGILETAGAATVRCPLVAIMDAPDTRPVDAWLEELATRGFDDVILLTGEGLRRLLARARVIGHEEAVRAALGRARKITRGPKPARALHEIQLATDLPAVTPTTQGIMDTLAGEALAGHRIGLQLYGSDPNEKLVRFLGGKGAVVRGVAPYVYAPASDEDRVAELVSGLERGSIDVIAFTSASQVERLFEVARSRQIEASLRAGLERAKVAAIGPIVTAALAERGVRSDIVPEQPFVMKRLTAAITSALSSG
jgi:uroporphyrinogen-III synthase